MCVEREERRRKRKCEEIERDWAYMLKLNMVN